MSVVATLLPILWVTACTHTAPFVTGSYGAVGPFREIAGEGQLTVLVASSAYWSTDGRGIIYLPELAVLPAGGGSATWDFGGGGFSAPAIDAAGRILVQMNEPVNPDHVLPFPVNWHAEYWLADTGRPWSLRRQMLTLYHDKLGTPTVSSSTVNWLLRASWAGPDTFVAVGQNLNPNGTFTTLGVYRGVIVDSATLTGPLPGTAGQAHFGFANGGHTVVFSDSTSLNLWTESFDTPGAPTVIATLPDTTDRSIVDLSCGAARCVIVTTELIPAIPGTKAHMGATLWEVDVATGALTPRWSFTGLPPLAALPTAVAVSPTAGDVVVVQNKQLYLLQGVLPD